MKLLTNTRQNSNLLNFILLATRLFVGFAMLTHGLPKLQKLLSGEEIQFFTFMGLSATASLALTVFAEVVCSIFLILGLFTRWASLPLIITMVVAAFIVHATDPFAKKELAIAYLTLYSIILAVGPGKISLDYLISGGKK